MHRNTAESTRLCGCLERLPLSWRGCGRKINAVRRWSSCFWGVHQCTNIWHLLRRQAPCSQGFKPVYHLQLNLCGHNTTVPEITATMSRLLLHSIFSVDLALRCCLRMVLTRSARGGQVGRRFVLKLEVEAPAVSATRCRGGWDHGKIRPPALRWEPLSAPKLKFPVLLVSRRLSRDPWSADKGRRKSLCVFTLRFFPQSTTTSRSWARRIWFVLPQTQSHFFNVIN